MANPRLLLAGAAVFASVGTSDEFQNGTQVARVDWVL